MVVCTRIFGIIFKKKKICQLLLTNCGVVESRMANAVDRFLTDRRIVCVAVGFQFTKLISIWKKSDVRDVSILSVLFYLFLCIIFKRIENLFVYSGCSV
jgi:hypothetical protein